jgi:hypothetical protein
MMGVSRFCILAPGRRGTFDPFCFALVGRDISRFCRQLQEGVGRLLFSALLHWVGTMYIYSGWQVCVACALRDDSIYHCKEARA